MSTTVTAEVALESIRAISRQDDISEHADQTPLQQADATNLSIARTVGTIATLTGVTVVSSFSNGLLIVGLPRIAKDVDLPTNLLLWPASVYP